MEGLDTLALPRQYASGVASPRDVLLSALERARALLHENIFIALTSEAQLAEQLAELELRKAEGKELPLYGVPFAVKDNIDVKGFATTAGCPSFAYSPSENASVVEKLVQAGAICLGKTNLDQFATGLVGVRSPYGVCRSAFDSQRIAGGSSSGSALAVAHGLVAFALGTDTAGSGRVPAAFNELVGVKPTRGWLSTHGVVPACRSLDCVSIFTRTARAAVPVLELAAGFDARDPFSRKPPKGRISFLDGCRVGHPEPDQMEFFGDAQARTLYEQALQRLEQARAELVTIDYEPFLEAGRLLYGGGWLVERLAAVGSFIERGASDLDPIVRRIILGAKTKTAVDVFQGFYELAALRQRTLAAWEKADLICLPTTGTTYTVEEVLANPVTLNANLGYYTTFANLLDLTAVAVPAGRRDNGMPFGITLVGAAHSDFALLDFAVALGDATLQ